MITRKHALLLGLRMTPMERAAGRFMRAPDHPEGETPPAPGVEDDAFSAAFDEHTAETPPAPVDNGGSGGGGNPPAGDEPPAAATPPAGTPPAETPAAPAAGDPPADGATPPVTPPVTPPAAPPLSAEEAIARLADVLRPQETEQPAAPAGEQPVEAPIYTPADQAVIAEYQKNWPDVAAAEQLVRRAEYHDLLKYVFTQVQQFIAPMQDTVRAMGNSLHTTELKGLVPDYTVDMEPQVNAWIDTQPDYLQAPMKQVMMTGTSDQMANLIGRFRAETGTPAPAAPAPSAPAAPAPAAAPAKPVKTELSSAAKQAAESLAPVSGTRTHVAAQDEASQDFSSAFERFAVDN